MSRFVERAIERAGLSPLLEKRRRGERVEAGDWQKADLLVLGAVADQLRSEEIGETVAIHASPARGVRWVEGTTDLELLRAVAIARIEHGGHIGVDWGKTGLEVAQVALGFGASDLAGPITRKSGLPIYEDEAKKVKGEGMVELAALKRREITLLVKHAGRLASFLDQRVEGDIGVQQHP